VAVVRIYLTLIEATTAADFLASNGIPASVACGLSPFGTGSYTVNTGVSTLAAAKELLHRLDYLPIDDLSAVDEASIPDLSLLDPRTPAPCPACTAQLPLDRALASCPSCGVSVDVLAILLERHGPEILSACYTVEPVPILDEVLDAAGLHCPVCHYSLQGLPKEGVCPECGMRYSKAALLRPDQLPAPRVSRTSRSSDPACAGCGYSLRGLPRNGVCPECGKAYLNAGLPPEPAG